MDRQKYTNDDETAPRGDAPEVEDAGARMPAVEQVETERDAVDVRDGDDPLGDQDEEWEEDLEDPETTAAAGGPVRWRRILIPVAAVLGAIALLAVGFTGGYALARRDHDPVVATVNGESIHRSEYDHAVAQNAGSQVLDDLVTARLIEAEAKKRGITVSDEQLARLRDEQRANFQSDQEFQAALARAGITDEELSRRLRLNELVRQLVADQTQVSDQEVSDRYDSTKDQYPGQTLDQVKDKVRSDLEQEKTENAVPSLLQQLKSSARIETHVPGATS